MLSDGTRTYTWQHGRELATVTRGSKTWTNIYNANGLRTKRTDGSVTFTYYYVGDKLTQVYINGIAVQLIYDANGGPLAVRYNGVMYYYVTNLQGDVTAILDTSGTAVVRYTYDAWGKILATTGSMASSLGIHNPLRYRGYVYDQETQLYYLQSRYYDPEIGRFINADDTAYLGADGTPLSYNLFAYCKNNPVSFSDPSGHFAFLPFWGAIVGGAIGGTVISTVSYVVGSALSGQEITSHGLINAAVTGAVSGAVGGAIGTIRLATKAATVAAKGIASVGMGIVMGIKSGIETNGSTLKRVMTGISTGLITVGSTFWGSQIDAYDVAYGFWGNMFTNSAATLLVGTPAEIVSVASQQGISAADNYLSGAKSSSYSSVSGRINGFSVALAY